MFGSVFIRATFFFTDKHICCGNNRTGELSSFYQYTDNSNDLFRFFQVFPATRAEVRPPRTSIGVCLNSEDRSIFEALEALQTGRELPYSTRRRCPRCGSRWCRSRSSFCGRRCCPSISCTSSSESSSPTPTIPKPITISAEPKPCSTRTSNRLSRRA